MSSGKKEEEEERDAASCPFLLPGDQIAVARPVFFWFFRFLGRVTVCWHTYEGPVLTTIFRGVYGHNTILEYLLYVKRRPGRCMGLSPPPDGGGQIFS